MNLAMLVLAANSLHGMSGTDSIDALSGRLRRCSAGDWHDFLHRPAGFVVKLHVGRHLCRSEIMHGLLHVNAPMWACRVVTLVPALIVLWFAKNLRSTGDWSGGAFHRHSVCRDPTHALYAQQGTHGQMG